MIGYTFWSFQHIVCTYRPQSPVSSSSMALTAMVHMISNFVNVWYMVSSTSVSACHPRYTRHIRKGTQVKRRTGHFISMLFIRVYIYVVSINSVILIKKRIPHLLCAGISTDLKPLECIIVYQWILCDTYKMVPVANKKVSCMDIWWVSIPRHST